MVRSFYLIHWYLLLRGPLFPLVVLLGVFRNYALLSHSDLLRLLGINLLLIIVLLLTLRLLVLLFVILSIDSIEASGRVSAIFLIDIGLLKIEIGRFKRVLRFHGLNGNPWAMRGFCRRLALRAHDLSFNIGVNIHEPFLLWDTIGEAWVFIESISRVFVLLLWDFHHLLITNRHCIAILSLY